MNGSFEVRTADELLDAEFTAKWRDRAALDPLPREVLGEVLDGFIASEGPVDIATVVSRLADRDPAEVPGAIALLDEKDLLLARGGQVLLAYPFSGVPDAFRVVFPDRRERYACCAIDALGVAPMLGHPVTVRSRCHHCGETVELPVRPDGPVRNQEAMVWVGERAEIREKASSSLWLTLNFFRSEDHLRQWWMRQPDRPGAVAALAEAFRLGAMIFGQLLRNLLPDGALSNNGRSRQDAREARWRQQRLRSTTR